MLTVIFLWPLAGVGQKVLPAQPIALAAGCCRHQDGAGLG